MTCIIGVEHNGKAWVGSDGCTTLVSNNIDMSFKSYGSKIIELSNGMLIGCAGDVIARNLLYHRLDCGLLFDFDYGKVDGYIYNYFQDKLKECLKDYVDGDNFSAIISWYGKMYCVCNDFHILHPPEHGVFAVGSGGNIALGAMYEYIDKMPYSEDTYSLQDLYVESKNVESKIRNALMASSFFDNNVAPPFDIRYTEVLTNK